MVAHGFTQRKNDCGGRQTRAAGYPMRSATIVAAFDPHHVRYLQNWHPNPRCDFPDVLSA